MVLKNNQSTVSALNAVMVDNNPISLISCLKSNSVTVSDTSRNSLLNILENLFSSDKKRWVMVVKCFKYDPNVNNYTTDSKFKQNLIDTYSFQNKVSDTSKLDLTSIFQGIGDFIGGSSTTSGGSTTTTNEPAVKSGVIFAIVVVVIVVVLIVAFKK